MTDGLLLNLPTSRFSPHPTQVYIKHAVDNVKMDSNWGRVFYTNLLASVPLIFTGASQEATTLMEFEVGVRVRAKRCMGAWIKPPGRLLWLYGSRARVRSYRWAWARPGLW